MRTNKSNNDLFLLIKSLTRSEKRQFRIYTSRYSNAKELKSYTALFNTIEKQKQFDEKPLQAIFGKSRLPVLKNYLYEMIVKSIRESSGSSFVYHQVLDSIKTINILLLKSLFSQAASLTEKTKKICIQNHFQHELLIAIDLEKKLFTLRYTPVENKFKSGDIQKRKSELISDIHLKQGHENLLVGIRNEIFEGSKNLEGKQIINLLQDGLRNNSQWGESDRLCMEFYMFYLQHDQTRLEKCLTQVKEQWFLQTEPQQYDIIRFFEFALLSLYLSIRNKKILLPFYKELLAGLEKNKSINNYCKLFLQLCKVVAQKTNSPIIFDDTNAGSDLLMERLHAEIYYYTALNHFYLGNLDQALKLQTKIINSPVYTKYTDIQVYARLTNLATNFDSSNFSILGYLHQQTYGYIQRCGILFEFETHYLNYMRTVKKFHSITDKKIFYEQLQQRLNLLIKSNLHPFAYRFDYMWWIQKRLNQSI